MADTDFPWDPGPGPMAPIIAPGPPRDFEDDHPAGVNGANGSPPAHLYEAPIGIPARPAPKLKATRFAWRAEAELEPRRWLYGRHLIRKYVSVDVAGGGMGKSAMKIGEALAMASGRPIYGREIHDGPLTVWLYNLEDPVDEIERRIHATAKWFKIPPEEVEDRLYVDSGRDQRCVIAHDSPTGATIVMPVVEQLKEQILTNMIDVLIVDPFVSSHEVNENDNRAIDTVVKMWARIAGECGCAINLVHQVRKQNGAETTAESARGAKALTDAARSVVVYNRMTEEEAGLAGIRQEQRRYYFRTENDKANLAPPEGAEWFRMNNVDLANGDQVGVVCPWTWPELFDGISTAKAQAVQRAVAEGKWRKDPRAEAWVGHCVAPIIGLDIDQDRERVKRVIAEWVKNDVLRVVEGEDEKRRVRAFVEVGKWIAD